MVKLLKQFKNVHKANILYISYTTLALDYVSACLLLVLCFVFKLKLTFIQM